MKVNWEFKGKDIKNVKQLPTDSVGFIYIITFSDGKQYIGKKNLYTKRKRKFGKKEIAAMTDKRLKKYEVIIKESDWLNYNGSNKDINSSLKDGSLEIVKREILKICFTNKQITYYETQYLFSFGVLEYPDKYYNDNILGKFYHKDITDPDED